ncbi:MAG: HAD family hydrolase [Actinomycetota bacterium]
MFSPDQIDAVVFDMGGVFIVPNPVVISGILQAGGLDTDLDPALAADAHYAGIRGITDLLASQDVVEHDLNIWDHYDRDAFSCAGLAGDDLDRAVEIRGAARRDGSQVHNVWNHRLAANIEAFHRISEVIPVAIVSNNDGTAIDQCRMFGICQLEAGGPLPHVPAIVDSTTVGIAKPDPGIFDPAIDALGTERGRTLYIGDTVHADVLGAGRAGLPVVQLDPLDLHADHDHWRLPDLDALAARFGA